MIEVCDTCGGMVERLRLAHAKLAADCAERRWCRTCGHNTSRWHETTPARVPSKQSPPSAPTVSEEHNV